MCPLNMRLGPSPAPSRIPRTFARPSSTCCHWTRSPSSRNVSRTSSAIASSEPVKLGVSIAREAHSTSLASSIRSSATNVREDVLPEEADLVVPAFAPELEHDVRATGGAVLLDRRDAVLGRPRDRTAAVEQGVRHLRLRREPAASLHGLGHGRELLHPDPGELEARVGGAADVLELVRKVHPGDLARPVTPRGAVGRVDGGDD